MPTAESSNATFFLMADHSLDMSWAGTAAHVAFAPERPSSSDPEVRAVYAPSRRPRRRPARR